MQTWGEHVKSTQKGPGQPASGALESGPPCIEATALNTTAPCCPNINICTKQLRAPQAFVCAITFVTM